MPSMKSPIPWIIISGILVIALGAVVMTQRSTKHVVIVPSAVDAPVASENHPSIKPITRISMGIPAERFYQLCGWWKDYRGIGIISQKPYKTTDGVPGRLYKGNGVTFIVEEDGHGNASYVWCLITTDKTDFLNNAALQLFNPVHRLRDQRDIIDIFIEANDYGKTVKQFGPNDWTLIWKDKTKGTWELDAKAQGAPIRPFPLDTMQQ